MKLRLAHELLDDDEGTPEEVRRSLGELWWINQHLGGLSSWRRLLQLLPSPVESLLDIGAGTGQIAAFLGRETRAPLVVALDRRASHFGASGTRICGDAFRLPFADGSFDLVTCNLFFHHFHDDSALLLLCEMQRVARRAVIINDLARGWIPYLFVSLLGVRFSRITRHDAPRSVAQAYTRSEFQSLAPNATVLRLWPYRLGVIIRK